MLTTQDQLNGILNRLGDAERNIDDLKDNVSTLLKDTGRRKNKEKNIHAAGLTVDIVTAFEKRLRGQADEDKESRNKALDILAKNDRLTDFIVQLSEDLDEEFGG